MTSSDATTRPPSTTKRARLAARGQLPYEPSVVFSAALLGILLLVALSGEAWFASWQALLRQAFQQPDDLPALARAAAALLLRTVAGILGASLLCGWGAGWMQRRLSPPALASANEAPEQASSTVATAAPRWFAWLLAGLAVLSVATATYLCTSAWYQLGPRHLAGAKQMAGAALLLMATADLLAALLLTAWRHHRFAREQAMSRAEQAEELRNEGPPQRIRDELQLRRG